MAQGLGPRGCCCARRAVKQLLEEHATAQGGGGGHVQATADRIPALVIDIITAVQYIEQVGLKGKQDASPGGESASAARAVLRSRTRDKISATLAPTFTRFSLN